MTHTMATDELMTVDEIAAEFRLAESTFYSWRHLKRGPRSFKLGRRVVYWRSDAEAWLTEQACTTTRGACA